MVKALSDAIIVAIITGFFAVVGQWLISRQANEKRKADDIERDVRLDMRLQGVERRLDAHNSYADKIGQIQLDIATITTEIKNLKERV